MDHFVQCADGLQDDSVWGWGCEWSETPCADGATLVVHSRVWKPRVFGPRTEAEARTWDEVTAAIMRPSPAKDAAVKAFMAALSQGRVAARA